MVDRVSKPIDHEALVAVVLRHARRSPHAFAIPVPVVARTAAEGEAAAPAPPGEPIIDWDGLAERYRSNPVFVGRIAGLTLKAKRDLPARLREWAAAGDLTAIGEAGHDLKGAAGNLMAHRTSELANRVQEAARRGDPETPALALRLADALDAFLAELADRVSPADLPQPDVPRTRTR